jgi:N-methylhydantoinase A
MSFIIGIDVGGTFTDLVAVDAHGHTTSAKASTTPADPGVGLFEGLDELARRLGVTRRELLRDAHRVIHGTTVATNALLERKGAKVGLLTTEGHRDILEMREGLKEDRYNLRMPPPVPLVPRYLRLGVRERMDAQGAVRVPIDPSSLSAAIARLGEAAVDAVAICFLHSYRNPSHEKVAADAVRAALPGAFVSASHDVYPQIKEYERTSTTIINAYVGPKLSTYLQNLEARLKIEGLAGPLYIMLSHGGMASVAEAVRLAGATLLSGPAGGVAAAHRAASDLRTGNLIPFDMGGTSTDISIVRNAERPVSSERAVAGHKIALPSLDIVTLGAGGGSIARVDAAGILRVGPESAGAQPGPACYGRGGTSATVTDANVVLGHLDPDSFFGGRMRLDRSAAEAAIDRLARELGVDRMAAADGIYRLVNSHMAEGIRLVTVRRGVDPSVFTLLSFGGAAGAHVVAIARQLGLKRVVVPRLAPVFSAWGMLATSLRHELVRTHVGDAHGLAPAGLRQLFSDMEAQGRARLASFDGRIEIQRRADMRYGEQIFEIDVPLNGIDFARDDLIAQVTECFHRRHEELFTYALREQEAVLVNVRMSVIGHLSVPPAEQQIPPRPLARPSRRQAIYGQSSGEAAVYRLDDMAPGQEIAGPALIETETTTVLVGAGDRATTTATSWIDIAVGS